MSLSASLGGCSGARASELDGLPVYSTPELTPEWLSRGEQARAHRVASFRFVDQTGSPFPSERLHGKLYVANFFFTGCPSICPKMTANLAALATRFRDNPELELVSFSVNPVSDTPAVLGEFAAKHGIDAARWHLLTGDRAAIYKLARTSYFAEKRLGMKKSATEFLHTENMFLVDAEGHIRGVYNATLKAEVERVTEDVASLLGER